MRKARLCNFNCQENAMKEINKRRFSHFLDLFEKVFVYYALIPFIGCVIGLPALAGLFDIVIVPVVTVIAYVILHKKTETDMLSAAKINLWITAFAAVVFAVLMTATRGDINGVFRTASLIIYFPFILAMTDTEIFILTVFITYVTATVTCAICARKEIKLRRAVIPAVLFVAAAVICVVSYGNRPAVRYAGHGFDYMNGYSSTDFKDYTVYAEKSKLVVPDTKPTFMIEKESEMPILDGAEACYPLYASFAKAVYKDIDDIERRFIRDNPESPVNGKIVTFTNTVHGFNRLVEGDVDLFFGARPSVDQLSYAKECGVELDITPIGKEAFVFFVEEDNPVNGLTSDQVRAIYHGDIENWKEVGGKNQKIVAFQRPENSGSQTMMEYFMGRVSLKEPKTYETVGGMGETIKTVAQYANEDGAIGYSFRYFVEELSQEKGVKLLVIDGVAPTLDNIENGSYSLSVDLCMITRKGNSDPQVEKMKDFILSDAGQEIIRKTGYAGLSD